MSTEAFIYLDHNATTPLDPAAAESMNRIMREEFGNPSSPYDIGVRARSAGRGGKSSGSRPHRLRSG